DRCRRRRWRPGRDHRQPGELRACGRRRRLALRLGADARSGAIAHHCPKSGLAQTRTGSVGSPKSSKRARRGGQVVRKHMRRAAKAAYAISLAVAIVVGLIAAGAGTAASTAKQTVTIGTKNFTEQYVLGQLYKQALEAKGYKVAYKEN